MSLIRGKSYCVLHCPDKDKIEVFRVSLKRKLDTGDFDFKGVWFPEDTDFEGLYFSTYACFEGAKFNSHTSFRNAKFKLYTSFKKATFNAKTDFVRATFGAEADFGRTVFNAKADFARATFNAEAYFGGAIFCAEADFAGATFKSYVRFGAPQDKSSFNEAALLDFQFTRIDKPECVSFYNLYLHPHWFINVDCRKFEFVNVEWDSNLTKEITSSKVAKIRAPYRLLATVYRQLADNAESNHRYHEASRFRYNAFESQRIERFKGFVPWRLDWWYWLASGYGERVGQAFLVFAALIVLFAFGYSKVGFKSEIEAVTGRPAISQQQDVIGKPLKWKEALVYSAYVSILQKPEPKPLTFAAYSLVWAETILGPAQAALLALAIRRRFMR